MVTAMREKEGFSLFFAVKRERIGVSVCVCVNGGSSPLFGVKYLFLVNRRLLPFGSLVCFALHHIIYKDSFQLQK